MYEHRLRAVRMALGALAVEDVRGAELVLLEALDPQRAKLQHICEDGSDA